MNGPNINFYRIRIHNGSQDKGFEELCCQLARAENFKENCSFVRKGEGRDAGVECYWESPDKSERYGWQSKYLFDIKAIISQTKTSFISALERSSNLVKYYVCIPMVLSDSEQEGENTARKKWDKAVVEWQKIAESKKMKIEIELWDGFALRYRLTRQEHKGRYYHWFDEEYIPDLLLEKKCSYTIKTIHNRYRHIAGIHVNTKEAYELFDALVRSKRFYDKIFDFKNQVRTHFTNNLIEIENEEKYINVKNAYISCKFWLENLSAAIEGTALELSKELTYEKVIGASDNLIISLENLYQSAQQLEHNEKNKKDEEEKKLIRKIEYYANKLQKFVFMIENTFKSSSEFLCAKSRVLLITGGTGIGKTYLLSKIVEQRIEKSLPTLFILGENFTSLSDPWEQIFSFLGKSYSDREIFLDALESIAESTSENVLIVIDAINDGQGAKVWKSHITNFISELKEHPRISLAISIRTDFINIVLPEQLRQQTNDEITYYEHRGFEGYEEEAMKIFFSAYGINMPEIPVLSPEFSNPLLLKLYSDALRGLNKNQPSKGEQSLSNILDLYCEKISESINGDPPRYNDRYIGKTAITKLANEMGNTKSAFLHKEAAIQLLNLLDPIHRDYCDTLYYKLTLEGVLTEIPIEKENGDVDYKVCFTYQRFSDYIIAKNFIEEISSIKNSKKDLKEKVALHPFLKNFPSGSDPFFFSGLIEALCIQIPEKFGVEYFDLFPVKKYDPSVENFAAPFVKSVIWRAKQFVTEKTINWMKSLCISDSSFIDILLTLSSIPNHPFNADKLHFIFSKMTMAERDSTLGNELTKSYVRKGIMARIIDWCLFEHVRYSEHETLRLYAIVLCWALSSPNKSLRDGSTRALINLLKNKVDILIEVIRLFEEVDDLYIKERLLCVSYGISLIHISDSDLRELALYTYKAIFLNDSPPPNVLLRDYARGIIMLAKQRSMLNNSIDLQKALPPYNSKWPISFPSKKEMDLVFSSNGLSESDFRTKYSIQTELYFGYFGRYRNNAQYRDCYWYNVPIGINHKSNKQVIYEFLEKATDKDSAHTILTELEVLVKNNYILFDEEEGVFDPTPWVSMLSDAKEEGDRKRIKRKYNTIVRGLNDNLRKKIESFKKFFVKDDFLEVQSCLYKYLKYNDSMKDNPEVKIEQLVNWILKKVFEMGWDLKKFRYIDFMSESNNQYYRESGRVAAKYTWLAMRELHCYLNDHLKFKQERDYDREDINYCGPWQTKERDIDPSFSIDRFNRKISDNFSLLELANNVSNLWEIVKQNKYYNLLEFLEQKHPTLDESLVLHAEYSGHNANYNEKEEFLIKSFFMKRGDVTKFSKRLENSLDRLDDSDFRDIALWEDESLRQVFICEYPWARSYMEHQEYEEVTIHNTNLIRTTFLYEPDFDPEIKIAIPSPILINKMHLKWFYNKCNFTSNEDISVTDSIPDKDGFSKLLFISKDRLMRFLEENDLMLLCVMYGERFSSNYTRPHIHAYCFLGAEEILMKKSRFYPDTKQMVESENI